MDGEFESKSCGFLPDPASRITTTQQGFHVSSMPMKEKQIM